MHSQLHDTLAQIQTKQIMDCIAHANKIGLRGKTRIFDVIFSLSCMWGMAKEDIAEMHEVKLLLKKRIPKKDKLIASENYINRLIENIQFKIQ